MQCISVFFNDLPGFYIEKPRGSCLKSSKILPAAGKIFLDRLYVVVFIDLVFLAIGQ